MITTSARATQPPDFVVSAFRYSDDPPAMAAFLSAVGLDLRSRTGDAWYDLRGRNGAVTVHGSRPGEAPGGRTDLVLITPDARAAVTYLETRQIGARAWDESFGLQAEAASPFGRPLSINEEQTDFYGSQSYDPEPGPVDVLTVFFTDDHAAALAYFAHFGFAADSGGSSDWKVLRRHGSGAIGLHTRTGSESGAADSMTWVGLGFETPEPLPTVAERLRAAGYQPELFDGPSPRIEVNDPDGVRVEVHPAVAESTG